MSENDLNDDSYHDDGTDDADESDTGEINKESLKKQFKHYCPTVFDEID